MKNNIALYLGLVSFAISAGSIASELSDLSVQSEQAKQVLQSYQQCDYAHPDYCYELIRKGCTGNGYNYNSYGSYGGTYGYGCNGTYGPYSNPYSPYSPYNSPYSPYGSPYNYQYSEGKLSLRYSVDDVDSQTGFIGTNGNKIYYSPDLQRLFDPSNAIDASK